MGETKSRSAAALLLAKQLKGNKYFWAELIFVQDFVIHWRDIDLTKHPDEGFSAGLIHDDNLFEWAVMVIGPVDTP